jgi:transporter family-2 protein
MRVRLAGGRIFKTFGCGARVNNLYLLLALGTGAGVAVMAVFNARLGGLLGGSVWAAAAQFSVALTVVLSLAFLTRQPAPLTAGIGGAPWWIWTGGVFSATFIVVSTFLTPRLGVAVTLATIIVGQLCAALIVDHFGLFGGPVVRASFIRVAGVALLLAGISLMRWRG